MKIFDGKFEYYSLYDGWRGCCLGCDFTGLKPGVMHRVRVQRTYGIARRDAMFRVSAAHRAFSLYPELRFACRGLSTSNAFRRCPDTPPPDMPPSDMPPPDTPPPSRPSQNARRRKASDMDSPLQAERSSGSMDPHGHTA
jgi:hypothetical protein